MEIRQTLNMDGELRLLKDLNGKLEGDCGVREGRKFVILVRKDG